MARKRKKGIGRLNNLLVIHPTRLSLYLSGWVVSGFTLVKLASSPQPQPRPHWGGKPLSPRFSQNRCSIKDSQTQIRRDRVREGEC